MRPWNTTRATAYGAVIGLAAAAIKSFAPWSGAQSGAAIAKELIGASLAFALLCGLAAALRNLVQRRLARSESGQRWRRSNQRSCPGRSAACNGALLNRDRCRHGVGDDPGSAVHQQ